MNIDHRLTAYVREIIEKKQRVAIVTHHNPDGDAVGSTLGLGLLLESRGCPVTMITPNPYPYILAWMEGAERIISYKNNAAETEKAIDGAEAIFFLDMNEMKRLEEFSATAASNTSARRVLIDHHLDPPAEYDYMFSDTSASSTCYMVYQLICELGLEPEIDRPVAQSLYTGMATDTGNFSYGNLTPDTYRAVASLVEKGADPVETSIRAFGTMSETRLRLLGETLRDEMVVNRKYRVCYAYITQQMLQRYHYRPGDTEGFVNTLLSVEGVDMAVIFIELRDYTKVSLRSRGAVDVNDFSRRYFSGGGHRNASGGKSSGGREAGIRTLLNGLKESFGEK